MASSQGGSNNAQIFVKGGTFGNFNFRYPASRATVGNFTGYGDNGSAAFGTGRYEMTPWQGFLMNSLTAGSFVGDNDQGDRTVSWNSGPYWGVRPAPWTTPCITPLQLVTLAGTLPAITLSSGLFNVNYPLLWSGQMYRVCGWNLNAPAFNAGTTYAQGDLVTSVSVVYISRVAGNVGNTPASSPTQWLPFHYNFVSNSGVGFSYGQNIGTSNGMGSTFLWNIRSNSPFAMFTGASTTPPDLFFPGLGVQLAGTQTGCTTAETFIIREVHLQQKYLALFQADRDVGGAMVPSFSPTTPFLCSNNVITQPPYSFSYLN